ncbi:hypothetical protein ABZX93_33580 [Streptomyces sp. NPDC006632]|uniref:hypothetical protein n=1 Tax=Streptomyces sp. NPDC006632 TaxID=3157182 RepID=UPI0033B42DCF
MTDEERAFVQAFWRQTETTRAVLSGPDPRAQAAKVLPDLITETHQAMRTAGLLGASEARIESLVREVHPEFSFEPQADRDA